MPPEIPQDLPFQKPVWHTSQSGASSVATDTAVAVVGTLTQPAPSFSEWDQANGKMKDWRKSAKVWSSCTYMGHQFEVIQSWSEKLLMLSDAIMKSGDDMRKLTRGEWMATIATSMQIVWLRVMSREQMEPIQGDTAIFSISNTYLSSSPDDSSDGFLVWIPDYSYWDDCYAGNDSCYNGFTPMALRCVVALS